MEKNLKSDCSSLLGYIVNPEDNSIVFLGVSL